VDRTGGEDVARLFMSNGSLNYIEATAAQNPI
jgi:hypothetical protein